MYQIQCAALSDTGRVRHTNQDSFGSDDALGLWAVCDGMGGAAGGDLASGLAVQSFLKVTREELRGLRGDDCEGARTSLRRGAAAANRTVRARAAFDTRFRGMGSTLVAARVWGKQAVLLNVGDSRAYLFRDGVGLQLTLDHSFVAEQIRLGLMTEQQAALSPLQSVITRAVGVDDDLHPELFEQELLPGDVLLLTTDGLTRHVDDAEIAAIVGRGHGGGGDLLKICRQLVDLANSRGGSDNITCLLLRMVAD